MTQYTMEVKREVVECLLDMCSAGFASRLLTSDMRVLRINEESLDVSFTIHSYVLSVNLMSHYDIKFDYCGYFLCNVTFN